MLNDPSDDPMISPIINENILIQSGTNLIRLGNDGNDNWSSDLIGYGFNIHLIDEDLSDWFWDIHSRNARFRW